ncbi:MAG: signal peptidase I, partial [Bacteroidales bacterium]|nr:signal peptidase I [Bacteroidales bacterium]
PHNAKFAWNKDNFGPLVIPKKGVTVALNDSTIALYDKIIRNYELNTLEVRDGKILVNGKEAREYTFKQNYYFMMGDNRHNSADSRFWGFVPEDHIVGKPVFVWLSLDKYKTLGEGKIRWNRMFRSVKNH